VRADKSSLLRLAAVGGFIEPDPEARLPGRGAYLHPGTACFELARRRRAFPRALRVPGALDTARLADYLSGGPFKSGHLGHNMTDGGTGKQTTRKKDL
jgi:uncharacterized protein